jgi:integrase
MARNILTDAAIRKAKPRAAVRRLADGENLYLAILPSGIKTWQFRYRHNDKPQTATLGKYPRVGLEEARMRADKVRKLVADGAHVTTQKREERLRKKTEMATLFKGFAEHWVSHEARRARWTPDYRRDVEQSIARHLEPLHGLPLVKVTAPAAVAVLRGVERKAPMMAEKVRRRLRGILDFAVEEGLLSGNPFPARRRGPKIERKHFPAVTDRIGIGEILRKARSTDPAKGISRAHLLAAFTAQRIAEVTGAKWVEFELDGVTIPVDGHRPEHDQNAGNWTIPRERMKVRDADRGPHVVPIPPRLLADLRAWREADGPDAVFVCPAPRDPMKPITPEGVEKHYRDALELGGKHSPHSWRSSFKTVCADAGKDSEVVEAQLDHVVGNKVASAYDRARRLELRRKLMQWYERELLAARDGGQVVPLRCGGVRP